MGMTFEPKVLNVEQLEPFKIRDVRQSILDKIQERIEQAGYNPSRPLSVVQKNGKYIVADGNHRLEVIRKLGIQDVPCVVYQDDPYSIATKSNQDEDTYAPMDLFDWLDVIRNLLNIHKLYFFEWCYTICNTHGTTGAYPWYNRRIPMVQRAQALSWTQPFKPVRGLFFFPKDV